MLRLKRTGIYGKISRNDFKEEILFMLQKMEAIACRAGEMMLKARDAAVHQKEGHFNFVTDADAAIEAYLKEALLPLIPGSRFFGEEEENDPLTDDPTFVVDPIDGTTNFIRNRNLSVVSIALLEKKTPVLGIIYNPYSDEMFTAEKGKGAYLNGEKIHVSDIPFENALISYGTSPYDAELAQRTMRAAEKFLLESGDLRRSGSAAVDLADVACGRSDIMFEMRLRPWDIAAGSLLVQEAGGVFYSLGHDAPYYDAAAGVLAANMLCHEKALEIMKEVLQ